MSTRSAIIKKTGNNYYGIYCHSDGYLNGVGATLLENYNGPIKVHGLIELGSLSTVGENLDFASGTVAYHRDIGIEYEKPYIGKTINGVAKHIGHNGYVYVFENNTWMVWITTNGLTEGLEQGYYPLAEVVELEQKEEKPIEYNCIHCGEPIYPTWYPSGNNWDKDWKHKETKEHGKLWCCYGELWSCVGGFATPPKGAIWTEPKIKEDGEEQ